MSEVDATMRAVRTAARDVLEAASAALYAGVPVAHVHDHYVRRAVDLLTQAETQALLAAEGDRHALAAIESCADELTRLRGELGQEST